MAGKQSIDELISDKAFEQADVLTAKLATLNATFDTSIENAKRFSDTLAGAKSLKDINVNSAKAAIEVEKLNKSIAQTAIVNERLTQATLRTTTMQNTANKATAAASSEYAKLLASYNAATLAARNAGATFGTQSQQFTDAGAKVKALRGQLDAIDQPLGNFQRNVGNYASGIVAFGQKAFGAIRIIANILPGLGLSGAFLLIFEGLKAGAEALGLFNDKTKDLGSNLKNINDVTKEANKAYAEQATKLKILYDAATDTNNKEKDRIAAAKELQNLFPQTFKNSTIQSILLGNESAGYQQLTKDLLENAKAQAALSKISEIYAEKLNSEFQVQKIKNAQAAETRRLNKQIAGGNTFNVEGGGILEGNAQKQIDDRAKKAITLEKQNQGILQGQIDFLSKFAGGENKIAKSITDKDFNKLNPKAPDTRKQVLDQQLKDAKLSQDTILQDEKSSYEERILAVADYENTVSNLLAKARKGKVITALEESNYFKELDLQTGKERKNIADKVNKELQKAFDDGVKNANTALQQEIIDFRDAQDTKLLEIEQYQAEALQATADLYNQGKISTAQYNQQVYDIEKQAAKDRIDLQIQTLKKILETQKANLEFGIGDPKDIQKTQNMIAKLEIDASNLVTKTILDNINKVKQARKDLHDLEKQIADQSIELIQTLVDGSYQRQLDALSIQGNKITENADIEKAAVDRSLASDEEKANKKNLIDARTKAQNDVIAAKEREVKTRQAKFDKAISIARIIEATGIAEVQALSYLSNPFTAPLYPAIAAAIGVLGAVQLATVIATPIPKYAKGTDYHKGGPMIVGDAGTELVIEPNGRRYLTPDTDTLTSAPAGTKVLTNHEVVKMLAKPEKINYVGGQSVDIMQLVSEQRKTTKAIQGQKIATTVFSKGGMKRAQQDIANRAAYRKQHFN